MIQSKSIEFSLPTKIIFGTEVVDRIGEITKEYTDKVFLVTNGKVMRKSGLLEKVEGILKKSNVNLAIASYHIVDGEKTYMTIEKQLRDLGYEVKTEFPTHLTTYAKKSKFGSINITSRSG